MQMPLQRKQNEFCMQKDIHKSRIELLAGMMFCSIFIL